MDIQRGVIHEDDFISGSAVHSDIGGTSSIRVLRTLCARPVPSQTLRWGGIDAYLARLFLKEMPRSQMSQGGRQVDLPYRVPMETVFRDIDEMCDWPIHCKLDIVSFELPRAALQRWAEDAGHRNFAGLKIPSGMASADEIIKSFGLTLAHCLDSPHPAPQLFMDYLLNGMCAYFVDRYGGRETVARRGGLAPWQARRAKELIDSQLDGRLSLRQLADQCGLSVAHFSRAFRDTTGTTPHRWLIQRRVSKSVGLLKDSGLRLAEIALMCGFADHSHFTQTFTKILGVSPSAYRRALGKGDDDAIQNSIDALRRSEVRELGARSWTSSIRLTTQQ